MRFVEIKFFVFFYDFFMNKEIFKQNLDNCVAVGDLQGWYMKYTMGHRV
jgi:hypothetical protein